VGVGEGSGLVVGPGIGVASSVPGESSVVVGTEVPSEAVVGEMAIQEPSRSTLIGVFDGSSDRYTAYTLALFSTA
jgi:hypothetical protein